MTRPHVPDVTLVALEPAHAAPAAALVAERVRALRETAAELPEAWADESTLARLISQLALRGSGVAALAGRRLVGFQAATLIDGHGGRWSYTPDFGHAASGGGAGRTVEALYARLAEAWTREACLEHVVTTIAGDDETTRTLIRLGFGQAVIDLVRDLAPVRDVRPVPGLVVRRAGPADTAAVVELDGALRRHLAASPIFLRVGPARPPELQRRQLADPAEATFLAEADGRAVSSLRIGPSADDVATIVRDPGTASITSAYTVPDRRGDGVATLLLDAALAWARDAGYVRAAVDHESANGEAFRFWSRHFTPVAVSLARRLPARVAP